MLDAFGSERRRVFFEPFVNAIPGESLDMTKPSGVPPQPKVKRLMIVFCVRASTKEHTERNLAVSLFPVGFQDFQILEAIAVMPRDLLGLNAHLFQALFPNVAPVGLVGTPAGVAHYLAVVVRESPEKFVATNKARAVMAFQQMGFVIAHRVSPPKTSDVWLQFAFRFAVIPG
jgi:hypothetical protein